jgi:hypothetical protein
MTETMKTGDSKPAFRFLGPGLLANRFPTVSVSALTVESGR